MGASTAGDWQLQETLGEGGTGTVFKAVHRVDGRHAAVKVLKEGLPDGAAARMDREARLISTLRHPNTVEVIETGRLPDGRPWLAMPLLKGVSLRAWMEQHPGPLDAPTAWKLLRPVALALDAAHAAGVVHRDVKPDNIFLDESTRPPTPRLIDFGLARGLTEDVKVTQTGTLLGTPLYMPPEQWWNQPITPAADQYSLTCVLFELLAGRPAHDAASIPALLRSHTTGPVPLLEGAPKDLSAVLTRAMSRTPADRFASVRGWVEAVDAACGFKAAPRQRSMLSVAWMLLTMISAVTLGYANLHNPRELSRLAGWGIWPVLGSVGVGALLLLLNRSGTALCVFVAAVFGTLGMGTGWLTVLEHAERQASAGLFELLQEGMLEANVNRWAASWLAAGLLTAWLLSRWDGRLPHVRSPLRSAGVATGLLGMAGVALGTLDAAWVCATACVVSLLGPRGRNRSEALGPALWRMLCVLLAAAGALARSNGAEAALWSTGLRRAERALAVTQADAQHSALLAVAALALATVMLGGAWHLSRLGRADALAGHPRGRLMASLWAVWLVADMVTATWVWRHQQATWERLEPMFSTWSKLDPPTREGLPAPAVAPALRLARDVVALDAQRVGLTAALAQSEGTQALARDLSHRMAAEPDVMEAPVQLLLMVDRQVPWRLVSRALGVAYGLGIRRVQWLFTRGVAPVLGATAPVRAAYALPADFGALTVTLSQETGADLPLDASVTDLVDRLEQDTVLRVQR